MGKILVFLNLLFALVVGGFLLVDFATRTNWKKAYDELEREMKVARANNDVQAEKIRQESLSNTMLSKEAEKSEDQKTIALKTTLVTEKLQGDNEKLQKEALALRDVVKQREQYIIKIEAEKDQYFRDAQNAINERNSALDRNEHLLTRLREMEVKMAKMSLDFPGKSATPTTLVRNSNEPNPPATYVKGIIEKVDGTDKSLVQISVGSDAGLEQGHTLEVYRLRPQPEYLGQVRILEVDPQKAVGRLMRNPYGSSIAPRPGDEVASSIRYR
jgi:hypothetical protein